MSVSKGRRSFKWKSQKLSCMSRNSHRKMFSATLSAITQMWFVQSTRRWPTSGNWNASAAASRPSLSSYLPSQQPLRCLSRAEPSASCKQRLRVYQLYDSYADFPALVGTFESVDEARDAARKRDEAAGGKFFPQLVKDGKIIQDWGY